MTMSQIVMKIPSQVHRETIASYGDKHDEN